MDSDSVSTMMCSVDWAAWGTWAAVLVALGIAVADKIFAFFQRRRETQILAILVVGELALTQVRLEYIEANINIEDAPPNWFDALLAAGPEARDQFAEWGDKLQLPVLESVIERLPNVTSGLGTALAQVLAKVKHIRVGCLDPAKTPRNEQMPGVPEFMDNFREALTETLQVVRGATVLAGRLNN